MMAAVVLVSMQAMLAVPDPVREALDSLCAGWQLAPVIPEIAEAIKTRTPAWPPNLLPGDFNGDDAIDVAVLQECRGSVQLFGGHAWVFRDGKWRSLPR